MEKVFQGLNSENILGKPRRKITKYNHGNKHYILVEGEDVVHVEFIDHRVCEQGEVLNFMNRSTVSLEEFNKLLEDSHKP